MNVEQLVREYVEHAEPQPAGGIARALSRRVKPRPTLLTWAIAWLLAGVLVGWLVTR